MLFLTPSGLEILFLVLLLVAASAIAFRKPSWSFHAWAVVLCFLTASIVTPADPISTVLAWIVCVTVVYSIRQAQSVFSVSASD